MKARTQIAAKIDNKKARQWALGYSLLDRSGEQEWLWAILVDGTILGAKATFGTSVFDEPGRVWTETTFVPGDAEFIGNYAPPTNATDGLGALPNSPGVKPCS